MKYLISILFISNLSLADLKCPETIIVNNRDDNDLTYLDKIALELSKEICTKNVLCLHKFTIDKHGGYEASCEARKPKR